MSSESQGNEEPVRQDSIMDKIKKFDWKNVTVEPVMFMYSLGNGLAGPTDQAILYEKVCLNLYNTSICDNLYYNESFQPYLDETQRVTSQWQFYQSLCHGIPSLILVALFGSWSDRFSRKVPLLFAPIGSTLMILNYLLNAIFMDGPVGYLLIGSFLSGITGGGTTFYMAIFSYVSIVSKSDNRSARIAVVYAFSTLPHAISATVSGVLLDNTGYVTVYAIVLACYAITMLYIIFLLPDIKPQEVSNPSSLDVDKSKDSVKTETQSLKNLSSKEKCIALFDIQHFKESFVVTFQKRIGNTRACIILIVSSLFVLGVSSAGSVHYLFYRHPPLSWDQTLYGYYSGYSSLIHVTGFLIYVPIMKSRLHVSDEKLLLSGMIVDMIVRIWTGLCVKTWMVFLSPIIGYPAVVNMPSIRALISSLVAPDEYGKIFAVIAWLENLGHLIASYLFSDFLYPLTVDVHPGISFFISGILTIIPIGLVVWLNILLRNMPSKPADYDQFEGGPSVTGQINWIIEEIQMEERVAPAVESDAYKPNEKS